MCGGLYITAVAVGDCAMRCCSRCWCKQSRLMIPGDSSHELWCRWPTFINQRCVGGGERREQNKAQIDVPSTAAGISWLHWPRWPPSPAFICLNCDLSVPVRAAHSGLALTRPLLLHHAIQIRLLPTAARVLLIQWPLFTFTSCFLFISVQPSAVFIPALQYFCFTESECIELVNTSSFFFIFFLPSEPFWCKIFTIVLPWLIFQ